jgi:hypothetical protein
MRVLMLRTLYRARVIMIMWMMARCTITTTIDRGAGERIMAVLRGAEAVAEAVLLQKRMGTPCITMIMGGRRRLIRGTITCSQCLL